jgi:FKBP-type peptidyl-prolyl cis-trans isomerase (trigger factor)
VDSAFASILVEEMVDCLVYELTDTYDAEIPQDLVVGECRRALTELHGTLQDMILKYEEQKEAAESAVHFKIFPENLASQSARATVTELQDKAGVTNVSHGSDVAAMPRQPVVTFGEVITIVVT